MTEPQRANTAEAFGQHAWLGRSLTAQPFGADDGSADPALAAALAAGGRRAGRGRPRRRPRVPVVAVLGDGPAPVGVHGRPVDKSATWPIATWGPTAASALPVFASSDALAAWDAAARPVPAEGPRAALSAVQDGYAALMSSTRVARLRRAPAARAVGACPGPFLVASGA